MAALNSRGKLNIQNENFGVHQKKTAVDAKIKTSKPVVKKGIEGTRTRKPLGDLTNKHTVRPEVTSKKHDIPQADFNIKEEGFLHDHSKCIEAQQTALKSSFLDLVLPRDDSLTFTDSLASNQAEGEPGSPSHEPKELPMEEFSDWLRSRTPVHSPQFSPTRLDSAYAPWLLDPVEFELKHD